MSETKQPLTTLVAEPITGEFEFTRNRHNYLEYETPATTSVKIGNITATITCRHESVRNHETGDREFTHTTNAGFVSSLRPLLEVGIEIDFAQVLKLYVAALEIETVKDEKRKKKESDERWAAQWIHEAHTLIVADLKKRKLSVKVEKAARSEYSSDAYLSITYKGQTVNLSKKARSYVNDPIKFQFSHECTGNKTRTFTHSDSAVRMFVTLVDQHIQKKEALIKARRLEELKRIDVAERLSKEFGFVVETEEREEYVRDYNRRGNFHMLEKRRVYFTKATRTDWSDTSENPKKVVKLIIGVHTNSLGVESYHFMTLAGLSASQVTKLYNALNGE